MCNKRGPNLYQCEAQQQDFMMRKMNCTLKYNCYPAGWHHSKDCWVVKKKIQKCFVQTDGGANRNVRGTTKIVELRLSAPRLCTVNLKERCVCQE